MQTISQDNASLTREYVRAITPQLESKPDTPRFLITLDVGIGDAVAMGLSAVDQIIRHDPTAWGTIDVLCNTFQSEVYAYDPRINRIIQTDITFFPSYNVSTWYKAIMLDAKASSVVDFLRGRCYEAVLPSVVAPPLYFGLGSHIMFPDWFKLGNIYLGLHKHEITPLTRVAREMVSRSFGSTLPASIDTEEVLLYIGSEQIQKARKAVATIKERSSIAGEDYQLLVVAPDTASIVTRPPTHLLATALAEALTKCPNLIVSILPSYSEKTASEKLWHALAPSFDGRIFLLSAEPRATLLETTAFIDQADIFVTGDTGVMHLAAATKILKPGDDPGFSPRNALKTIALFGGTSPAYFGYSQRTMIVGRGRKEQMALRPGIFKDSYDPKGRDLFDHITPEQLAQAIVSQVHAKGDTTCYS